MKLVWLIVVVVGLASAQDVTSPSEGSQPPSTDGTTSTSNTQVRTASTAPTSSNQGQVDSRFLNPQAVGSLVGAGQALAQNLLGGVGPVDVTVGRPGGGFGGGQFGCRPGRFGCRPGQFGGRPGQFGCRPGQFGCRPGQFGGRPGQFGCRPGQFGCQSGQFIGQSGQFGCQPGQFGCQSGQSVSNQGFNQFGNGFSGNQFGNGFSGNQFGGGFVGNQFGGEKRGQCPAIRPCPQTRNFAVPFTCNNDFNCSSTDKCCFDSCVRQRVCKPNVLAGR